MAIYYNFVYNTGAIYDGLQQAIDCATAGDPACLGEAVGTIAYVILF